MSEDAPKIVSLGTSLELSEFLSESEFPSEAEFPSDTEFRSRTAPLADDATPSPGPLEEQSPAPAGATASVEPAPFAPALPEAVAAASRASVLDESAREAFAPPAAHFGPATVTEFPVRLQTPAAVAMSPLPPGPVALVDLIERRGGFDWREAVAVIHQICQYLKAHPPHAPILLDPRNIQITDNGEVHLLSGQTSSDPLVIQVGRLLRTMLMGKEAPPELRLLLAQATFELPIFESIDDVDRALAQLNKLDEPGPAGLALLRAVAAPLPPPDADGMGYRPAPIRSILPAQRTSGRRPRARPMPLGSLMGSYGSHAAVIVVGIAAIGALLVTRPALLFPAEPPPTTRVPAVSTTGATTPAVPAAAAAAPTALVPAEPEASVPDPRSTPVERDYARATIAEPREERATRVADPRPVSGTSRRVSGTPRPAATVGIAPAPAPPSPRDSERRAATLLKQGQTAEASMAFDSLVQSNPLYEPRATDLTPEALAAFRTSQRLLLPVIAQRTYERAAAALAAGDADRALTLAKETAAILDRRLADPPPQLREQVADLLERATVVAVAAHEIVYTHADADVIAPRPLSRQMPVSGPSDVPPNRVGWLDMVINRDGTVYSVKLHTPLNRHHERMIVSPAKAWRYRPAMKNGKPVMYRIMLKVTLPESGTDF